MCTLDLHTTRLAFSGLALTATLSASAAAQSWTSSHPVAPAWTIRYAASVAEQGGENQIFQTGGTDGLTSANSVWRFHRTDGWFVMGNMPGARHDHVTSTVEIGGQDFIHLLGGGAGATAATTTNWRYDVAADTWDAASFAPMPVAKANMEAVTAPDGRIYVFGGNDSSGATTYSSMHVYDPVADSWSAGPAMPRARRNFAALKDCDGYIYLYGGNAGATTHAEIDCFDTVTGTWVATNPHTGGGFPNMPTPRTDLAGALGRNGRHYLMGGLVASPVAVPTVEAFDPYTNTWSFEPSMLESRNSFRATGLGSRVWVLGGYRKIWPTTRELDSYGPLGAYGPCGDDVAPLPPPSFGTTFATALPLEFVSSYTGGIVHPGGVNVWVSHLPTGIKQQVQVDTGDLPNTLVLQVFDDQLNLLVERPAQQGIVLDTTGLQTQSLYVAIRNPQGMTDVEFALYSTCSTDPQNIGEVYCHGATPNSTGDPSGIGAFGMTSAAANDVELRVVSLPQQSLGYFLVDSGAGAIAHPGGSAGTLCLSGARIGRYAGNVLNSGSTGEVALQIDLRDIPGTPASVVMPGDTWYFTYWHRDVDPILGTTSNFSDGICIEFQ